MEIFAAGLDTPEKRAAVAARLDEGRWRPRNAEERRRNEGWRAMVLAGDAYILSPEEVDASNERLRSEIDEM